jgi:AraC family transcriptional regulator, arabinose operon regulatory protein
MKMRKVSGKMGDLIVTGHFVEIAEYATWRTKGTDDHLLIATLAGRGRFGYRAGEIAAEPGDFILIRPGTVHDYGLEPTLRHWELLWVHFHARPHWQAWLAWPAAAEAEPGLMRLRPNPESHTVIIRRMFDVYALAGGALPQRDLFAMNALEEVLLRCHVVNPIGDRRPIDPRVQAAMEFYCQNLSRSVQIEDAAKMTGLSPSRFAHLFREQAGVTPQRFLEQHRLNRALQLLETTQLSIKEIAHQVGFSDPFYFTHRFKHHFGMAPRHYRCETPSG